MFKSIRLLLLSVIFAAVSTGLVQGAQAPFTITINTSQTVVKAGSEVRLKIILTNTSNHEVFLMREKGEAFGEFDYDVDVRNAKGTIASETKYRRNLKGEGVGGETTVTISSGILFPVQPGKTLEEDVVISKLFDLSLPDKYSIMVHRTDDVTKAVVKSNTVTVTVTP